MIKNSVRQFYNRFRLIQNRNHLMRVESDNMDSLILEELSKEEALSIENRWKGISELKILPKYYKMFKTLEHFDPDFVSDDLFMPFILRKLNDKSESEAFVHKGLYDVLFKDVIKRPETLVNNINGTFYTTHMEVISKDEAEALLKNEQEFIIKPTVGSCMGRGVKKVNVNNDDFEFIFSQYKTNFITQKIVHQSKKTAAYNESSLNTFRVSTLNINGVVSLCTVLFRCGQEGSSVDNGAAGGYMIGVSEDGHLREYGYNNKYNKFFETNNGTKFSEGYFPNMQKVVDKVLEVHQKCLPTMGFAGWDIAMDETDDPVMIEVNLVWPGVQFEQLCPGKPIFGNRTEEVINYLHSFK